MFAARKYVAFVLTLLSIAASATPVTLKSNYTYAKLGTGTDIYYPAVFVFTYEDSAPIFSGSLATGSAQYRNAITSATIEWDRSTLQLDTTADNYVTIRGTGVTRGFISLSLRDGDDVGYKLDFGFEPYGPLPNNVDLAGLIGLRNVDSQPHFVVPNDCSIYYRCGYRFSQQDSLTQVPIPSAAWMLGSALLGLRAFGLRRRLPKQGKKAAR